MPPQSFMIGATCAHLLSDGIFWTDGGGPFGLVPRVLWEKVIAPDRLNRVPMHLRCLLVESSQGLILIDTGYGDKLPDKQREILQLKGEGRLLSDLRAAGFRPQDVDLVINTHLHGDHCGGNTRRDENGELVATFPRATYMMQRLELADACFPNERTRASYLAENYMPLGNGCQEEPGGALQILNGDTQITPELRTRTTPGHTRAHQSIIIESRGEAGIFLADAAAWAVSLERLSWIPAFDVEPLVSLETKRSLQRWAANRKALLFFQHDPAVAAGTLHEENDRWHVEPEKGLP
jgi:glyoxylase-like metal-dependent hydrolase (beta-lactamase superfamily II)